MITPWSHHRNLRCSTNPDWFGEVVVVNLKRNPIPSPQIQAQVVALKKANEP